MELKEILLIALPILGTIIAVIPSIILAVKAIKEIEIRAKGEDVGMAERLNKMAMEMTDKYKEEVYKLKDRIRKLEADYEQLLEGMHVLVKQIEDLGEEPKYRPED
jgi:predicted  nucleic acid-binding Zn-ribbon protein